MRGLDRRGDMSVRILVVDNYDSFTYNLVDYLGTWAGGSPDVVRNDDPRWTSEWLTGYDAVVLSPGPGSPDRARDVGICPDVIRNCAVPLLGVCLGHQCLSLVFGGEVGLAPEPYHGRLSLVRHAGDSLFRGVPSPFPAVRYHSLIVTQVPAELAVIAECDPGLPMAVRHRDRPLWGVQFHPESICTEYGRQLLSNFVDLARDWRARTRPPTQPSRHGRCRPSAHTAPPVPPLARQSGQSAEPDEYRVLWREMTSWVDPEVVFDAWYGRSTHAFWLDSSGSRADAGRFSAMGDEAGPLARVMRADVSRGEVVVSSAAGVHAYRHQLLDWLQQDLVAHRLVGEAPPVDLGIGWVGYLGYELKAECESPVSRPAIDPDAVMVFAGRTVVFDYANGVTWLLALARDGATDSARLWLDDRTAAHAALGASGLQLDPATRPDPSGFESARLRHDRDAYMGLIRACQDEIRRGESYEICLTNMIEVLGQLDAWPAYRALRAANPVPYGAFLNFADLAVLSASPERFLRIDTNRVVESKPIKGTRPRGTTTEHDACLRADLAASEKDRAENLMIVDLLRNDLGRSARLGSVSVPRLFDIESYHTVHQLVSTVRARLADDVHPVACLRAAYPGGSMTGAPKLRAMEIIDRLEAGPRGVYSGAIGYFSLSGAVDLSITIRTITHRAGVSRIGVGGAITALSDPEEEFEETAVKGEALLALFGQEFPQRRPTVSPGSRPHPAVRKRQIR